MAELRYGNLASCQGTQDHGFLYCNTDGSGHPHLDALEFSIPIYLPILFIGYSAFRQQLRQTRIGSAFAANELLKLCIQCIFTPLLK